MSMPVGYGSDMRDLDDLLSRVSSGAMGPETFLYLLSAMRPEAFEDASARRRCEELRNDFLG